MVAHHRPNSGRYPGLTQILYIIIDSALPSCRCVGLTLNAVQLVRNAINLIEVGLMYTVFGFICYYGRFMIVD